MPPTTYNFLASLPTIVCIALGFRFAVTESDANSKIPRKQRVALVANKRVVSKRVGFGELAISPPKSSNLVNA